MSPTTRLRSQPDSPTTPSRSTPSKSRHIQSQPSTSISQSPPQNQFQSTHHRTSDEIALEEAERLLRSPSGVKTRSSWEVETSARDLRHRKIAEAREKEQDELGEKEDQEEHNATDEDEEEGEAGDGVKGDGFDKTEIHRFVQLGSPQSDDDYVIVDELDAGKNESHNQGGLDQDTIRSKSKPTPVPKPPQLKSANVKTSTSTLNSSKVDEGPSIFNTVDVSEGSSSSSASDADSDADSDSASDSDSTVSTSEESDEEEERLEKLLQAAELSATQKSKARAKTDGAKIAQEEDGETVLQFDAPEEGKKKELPIPDLKIPTLPRPHLAFTSDGSAKAATSSTPVLSSSSSSKRQIAGKVGNGKAPELELDNRPYERELSRREKAAQPRKASASELWATLPIAKRDHLPQMKRDYQALALANSLDPKRFMKGGTKLNEVPEVFAIGSVVERPRHLQDTTLTREVKYRPGEIVQNMTRDENMGHTAKRKYGDLQYKRMENGRGKGWKKRAK